MASGWDLETWLPPVFGPPVGLDGITELPAGEVAIDLRLLTAGLGDFP